MSDALCLVSDHLQVDIFRLSVCNSTAVSDYVLTKVSIILQLLLLMRLNLSCYFVTIVLMTVSNFFLLLNNELFDRLKSLTTVALDEVIKMFASGQKFIFGHESKILISKFCQAS